MTSIISFRYPRIAILAVSLLLIFSSPLSSGAQSRPQKSGSQKTDQKKNQRPDPLTEEERKRIEEERNAIIDDEVERIETNVVNVDAVVFNKRTGQIITGLKKENFAIFENGKRVDITNFSNPESPITITLVVEFSKWTELFGSAAGGRFEPGTYEVIRPVAQFLTQFIKPPDDYASVIAFDLRPTPITDFTNDPRRINETVNLLLRSMPAFRENNLWDALAFALNGGKADSVVLENSKERYTEYAGLTAVRSKRKAIILVASGIDTFSRINYDQARRIVQEAGIPIYIISTGNLFFKRYEHLLGPTDSLTGLPGRLTFLQAQNAMNTIAKDSGGMHFSMTFESEIPGYLNSINALLRNQYSLAYDLNEKREPGKRYKIEVKVDVDGDGNFDDKNFTVQHRPFYTAPKAEPKKR